MIKTLLDPNRPQGWFFYCLISVAIAVGVAHATGPALTTVTDVIYRADGQPAAGTLVISWSAFTTADNKPVAAGELSLTLGAQGSLNTSLAPNEGAAPAGSYYKVVYKLSDGTTATEYWVVPVASPATVGSIRAKLVPTQVAAQLVSRQYVDSALSGSDTLVVHKSGSESITGAKDFTVSPTAPNPVASLGIANKAYVDTAVGVVTSGYVSKSGDSMSGPLTLPADPVSPNQAADRHYVDLQSSLATAAIAQLSYSTLPGRPDTFGFLINAVTNCGLVGNGVTNDGPALQACIAANPGKHIVLPKMQAVGSCDYNMGSTNIRPNGAGQTIEGVGAGYGQVGTTPNTTLCWTTKGVNGITVSGASPEFCLNCSIKNLSIQGPDYFGSVAQLIPPCNPPVSQTYNAGVVCVNGGDGVQVQSNFTNLENLYVSSWGRHGVNLDASCAGCSQFSDNFHIINVTTNNNRGDGWYTHGGDSNAGSALQLHAYSNQMYGIDETGFLGNSYYAPEAHSNHSTFSAGASFAATASRTSNVVTLTAAGHNFSTGNVIVVAGMSDATFNGTFSISATTSTTATYAQTAANSTATGGTARLTSSTEFYAFTGITGGGYWTPTGGAQWSTFYSPYCEGDQGPAKFGSRSVIIGGDLGCDIDYTVNQPFVIGHSVNGANISGPVMTYPTFYNRTDGAGVLALAAGNTSDNSVQLRFTGRIQQTPIYWEWVHNVGGAANAQTMTLWRNGNGQKRRIGFVGPGAGGYTFINDEGGPIIFNSDGGLNSSGYVQFFSGGASPAQVAQIDPTGKGTFNGGLLLPAGGINLTKTTAPATPASGNILLYADSTTGNATCITSSGTNCFAAATAPPTGTGFVHVTGGSQDSAARAIDVSTADITGVMTKSRQTATTMYTDQANGITAGKLSTAASSASGAGFNIPAGVAPTSPAIGDQWMVGANLFYRDNGGSPATQTIEIQSNRNSANGYAGLDAAGKVLPANLPAVSTLSGSVAASQMPAFSGDMTTIAGSLATTLGSSGVSAGVCVKPTVDAKGRTTGCSGTVSLTTDASGVLQATQFPALTGDVTTVAGALDSTLASSGVSAGTYNQVTVDTKGRVTAGANPGITNTTAVTVTGAVSTDQNLISLTLPAGSLNAVGKTRKAYAGGVYTTGASGAGTMTFKVKLCTVSGCGSGTVVTLATFGPTVAQTSSATNMPWTVDLAITTVTSGTSGTAMPAGT